MKIVRSAAVSIALSAALTFAHAPRVWAQPAGAPPAAAPDQAMVAVATASFKKGTALFQQKRFPLALAEFQKSYDTVASPNSLLYVARCQAELGQVKDAYRTFSRVIAEAEARLPAEAKYAPTRDSAKTEQDELAKKVALLTINIANADPDSRVKVGGGAVPSSDWGKPIPMDPGGVEVVLEHPTRTPITQTLTLEIGKSEVVNLDAVPAEAAPPPVTPPPAAEEDGGGVSPLVPIGIGVAGVGVVGFVIFAVAGSSANSTYDELTTLCGGESACPGSVDAGQVTELQDSGQSSQTLANIGLIVGAVGVAAGATLIVLGVTSDGGDESELASQPPRPRPGPFAPEASVAVAPGWAGLRGKF